MLEEQIDLTNKIEKKYYKLTVRINVMLLVTHMCFLALFMYLKVTLMVHMNVFSVLLYIFLFFYYKIDLFNYVFIVFLEIMLHMFLATISVGVKSGFQLYSFGLIPFIYMCDYLRKNTKGKGMHPFIISVIIVAQYLFVVICCNKNGELYKVQHESILQLLHIYNILITLVFLIVYMNLYETRILEKERLLADMAVCDQLTKLPNRHRMKEWADDAYVKNGKRQTVAMAIMDIDDFKKLNDTYGHMAGDEALKFVSDYIRLAMNDGIKSARWGGEEFIFLAEGKDAYKKICLVLENLRKNISEHTIVYEGRTIGMTVTIGVAVSSESDSTYEDIVKRADERLYYGKKHGKNILVSE